MGVNIKSYNNNKNTKNHSLSKFRGVHSLQVGHELINNPASWKDFASTTFFRKKNTLSVPFE